MPYLVTSNAVLACSFGMVPSTLQVLPVSQVMAPTPAASIMDNASMMNVMPFGLCVSLSNPEVSAATAAALGVFVPQPCIPVPVAPWTPGEPTRLIGGQPALTSDSMLMCSWGGCITITFPGQTDVMV